MGRKQRGTSINSRDRIKRKYELLKKYGKFRGEPRPVRVFYRYRKYNKAKFGYSFDKPVKPLSERRQDIKDKKGWTPK